MFNFLAGSEFCFRNFSSSSGMIESPGFPDKYPHNLECSYMIIAPPQTDITLRFLTFDLENDPLLVGEGDCKYDWLDVWDGLPQGERRPAVAIGRLQCLLPSWITCTLALKFPNSPNTPLLFPKWAPL